MKRYKHNLSHTQLLTGRMGQLLPIGLTEVLPGDTFQHASQVLIRAAPLATPPMHPVRIDVRHFFVPNRLLWENWEDFITGGPDGADASAPPYVDGGMAGILPNSLGDYLGIPPGIASGTLVNALPFRAYAMIWNEYYRDQDLQAELPISLDDGNDTTTNLELQAVNWEKDYFTTCRPWQQKGPDVVLPLGTSAPVVVGTIRRAAGGTAATRLMDGEHSGSGWPLGVGIPEASVPAGWGIGDIVSLIGQADLSSASAATVNSLRLAMALQRMQEARARYGSRYTEYLRYLGVNSSDGRLQRPEYLGGARTNLQFSEVLSSDVDASSPDPRLPGIFGGHGIGANRTNRYRRFFEEHGFVISLLSVIPQTMYPNGIFRHWRRWTREDYFQKELAHIGQQVVYNSELQGLHVDTEGVFGYQDRYDEYRRSESQVHGYFRPGGYLADWHFARDLPNNVALNSDFVTAQPSDLPFQVRQIGEEDAATLYIAVRHQLVARRLVPSSGSSFIM